MSGRERNNERLIVIDMVRYGFTTQQRLLSRSLLVSDVSSSRKVDSSNGGFAGSKT